MTKYLRSKGFTVLDLDEIAREVVKPGKTAFIQIVQEFGKDVVLPDGTLNRPKLGEIIFQDPVKRKKLDKITFRQIFFETIKHIIYYFLIGEIVLIVGLNSAISSHPQIPLYFLNLECTNG